MCDARPDRSRKPPPPSPRMLALLADMQAADAPVIWDYSRGFSHDTYTLAGRRVSGGAVTGLSWRGYLHSERVGHRALAYRLTDRARLARASGGGEG